MGAEIDRLELQVEAQATKANNQLDKLVGKLDALSSSLSHLNSSGLTGLSNGVAKFAQASAQLSNVKTADFTRLTKNIQGLASLNTQQIYGAASAMRTLSTAINSLGSVSASSMQVAEVAKSISKLGGVNVQRAITNLPALASALNNLMTTLSKAPSVSSNIIQMTRALADLASQGAKVGTAGTSLARSVYGVGTAMSATTKKARSFASVFGSIYQKYFWIMRGANKLWDSIKNSMNYVEVLNYFDAAFGQVAESAVSQWEDAGYSSAEAYYESFGSRAKELTSKMTGFTVNDDGTLSATGEASLGINPSKLMNYQATFAQMSSSMGVASETSLMLSQALTEIGADLASVKNMDFDKVWKDMASGLAGMSRTLDKYGVNIRNVNLQQKLFDLGIEENIANLNQNDKALLRAIILLDSTKYAWGDLADTLNQPANQLRLLESNFSNLSRTIGNLFLPVVSKVLPYVNGLVIGLQRLFTWVGNLLGIDLSGITSSVGDSAVDIGDLLGETDDLTDSLTDAGNAAKKLKSNLQSFDELNVITTQTDSASSLSGVGFPSGLLDDAFANAFSEYQKVWDEAFANMENRANEFADQVEKFLQPVRDIIEDFAIGDFFKAGQDTSNLVAGIFNFFADAIDNVDWYRIGENIGDYLAGVNWIKVLGSVGHLIWEALKAAFELWSGALSTAPIETALISMIAMPKILKAITASRVVTGISKLAGKFKTLGKNCSAYLQNLDATGQVLTFNTGVEAIRNNLTGLQKGVITAVAAFAEFEIVSHTFEGLVDGSEDLIVGIAKIGGTAGVAALAMYTALGPAGLAIAGVTGLVAAVNGINDAFNSIRSEEIGISIKNAMCNPGGVPLSEITANFASAFSEAASGFNVIKEKSSEMDSVQKNIEDTWTEIYKIQEAMDNGVLSVAEGKAQLETLFSELATLTEQKFSAMNSAIMSAYGEGGSFRTALESIGADTESAIDTMITYGYQNNERAKKIAQDLAGMDINSEEYSNLIAELASLTGEMSSFEQAASDFAFDMSSLQGKINYDEIFPNGKLNTEALRKYLDEASTALSDYEESLDAAGQEISKQWQEIINSTIATEEQKEVAQAQLDYIPQAIETMKSDAELQVIGFTDMLQNDFIAKTSQIIDDNVKEWEGKSAAEKWWNGVWGAGSEGEYVKEAVDQQQANIDELSAAIEESFGKLRQDGVAWASEAADEIYGALFVTEYRFSEMGSGKTIYELKENYKDIIDGATEGIADLAAERGKDTVDGYNTGISENIGASETEAKTWMEKVRDAIHDSVMNFGSPSKTTEQFGLDTVLGYNNGISENTQKTVNTISFYMDTIKDRFSNISAVLSEIGRNVMSGLLNGMSSMESDIYDKADSIADNIAKTIQKALDIHSPSRVMYALGEFTMQGFQLGMENLYGNIQKSIENFGGTLQYEIAPSPKPQYAGVYSSPASQTAEYNSYSYYENQSNLDTAETNMLLREILAATRAGRILECNGREIGRTVREQDMEFYDRTGKGMFEH